MSTEDSYLNDSLRKIAKGAGFVLIGTFIGRFFGYGSRVILARLGASDYGLISLGFAVMSITATLSILGMQTGIIRYVSFYKGRGDKGRIKGTIVSALRIALPLSVLLAIFLFGYASWIANHVFHDGSLAPIIRIFSIGVPFSVLARAFLSATIGFQDMRYDVYVQFLFQEPLKLVGIVVLLLVGFGTIGAAWGWVFAVIAMPFLALYYLEKRVFPILRTKVKAISVDKELFVYSFPLLFAGIAGLVMGWTDTLMLGYFSSASSVGIYNAALPTAQLVKSIQSAFVAIFFPVIAGLYARNRMDELRRTYSVVTKWMLSLLLPAFLLTALFSEQILGILFGVEYILGAPALIILISGYLVYGVTGPVGAILQTYGRTRIMMLTSYFGAVLNFLLNFILIPLYGITGAAIATAFSFSFSFLLNFAFVYNIAKMHPFRSSYFKVILASLLSFLVIYLISKMFTEISLLPLCIILLIFLTVYFFLLLLSKAFDDEDLMIMRAIDQKLGTNCNLIRKIIKHFL